MSEIVERVDKEEKWEEIASYTAQVTVKGASGRKSTTFTKDLSPYRKFRVLVYNGPESVLLTTLQASTEVDKANCPFFNGLTGTILAYSPDVFANVRHGAGDGNTYGLYVGIQDIQGQQDLMTNNYNYITVKLMGIK